MHQIHKCTGDVTLGFPRNYKADQERTVSVTFTFHNTNVEIYEGVRDASVHNKVRSKRLAYAKGMPFQLEKARGSMR